MFMFYFDMDINHNNTGNTDASREIPVDVRNWLAILFSYVFYSLHFHLFYNILFHFLISFPSFLTSRFYDKISVLKSADIVVIDVCLWCYVVIQCHFHKKFAYRVYRGIVSSFISFFQKCIKNRQWEKKDIVLYINGLLSLLYGSRHVG